VATTNADEFKMDAAITRPGRLSKMLDVGVLDYETARGVFKRLLPEAALPKELALEYDATQIEPHPSHSGLHYMGARAALMKEADKRMADFKMTLAEVYALARTNGWTAAPRKAENPEPEDDVEDESLWY
jgi:SpoVK/Ycf46/Vps4 family AAA+-type ATPase